MKIFKYKARNREGDAVAGEVEAPDEKVAVRLIRQRDLIVVSLTGKKEFTFDFLARIKDRVTSSDTTNFTRQLATMINAGLPITEALLILRTQSKGAMERIISQVLADVEEGEALSMAMGKNPQVFSKTYIALIKSGETGGVLDEVLLKLADDLEKEQEFQSKVRSALVYPAIIIVAMFAVTLIMFFFVIPRLTTLYEQFGATLPLMTRILIWISDMMVRFWALIFLAFFGLGYALRGYLKTEKGRFELDKFLLKAPLFGNLLSLVILTDLSRTLSLMVGSGVSIIESLNISSRVVGNAIVAKALKDVTNLVEKGFPLAFAFSRHPEAFPFIFSQMIAVGEETGKLDEVLAKVSHVFEVESDQKLKTLSSAIEPIILIILGIGVGFLVVSIILPIYNLTTQI